MHALAEYPLHCREDPFRAHPSQSILLLLCPPFIAKFFVLFHALLQQEAAISFLRSIRSYLNDGFNLQLLAEVKRMLVVMTAVSEELLRLLQMLPLQSPSRLPFIKAFIPYLHVDDVPFRVPKDGHLDPSFDWRIAPYLSHPLTPVGYFDARAIHANDHVIAVSIELDIKRIDSAADL